MLEKASQAHWMISQAMVPSTTRIAASNPKSSAGIPNVTTATAIPKPLRIFGPYSDMNSVMRPGTSLSHSTMAPGSTLSRIRSGMPLNQSAMDSPNSCNRPGTSAAIPDTHPRNPPSPSWPLIRSETLPGKERNQSKKVVPNVDSADSDCPGSFLIWSRTNSPHGEPNPRRLEKASDSPPASTCPRSDRPMSPLTSPDSTDQAVLMRENTCEMTFQAPWTAVLMPSQATSHPCHPDTASHRSDRVWTMVSQAGWM